MTTILVIDDDPTIRRLLQRALPEKSYEVILASDGEEGLLKAAQLRPALIICDWIMPGLSGIEVCRQVKATPELSTTFFVLLTTLGSVENRIKGLDAGADDFLSKPIEMNELKARVRAGLRLHQLSQDLQEQKQFLEAELAEAADYVRSLLPEPLTEASLAIEARFIPSRQLGGDGFDYFWLDDERLAIYLLDVSGHGLRAALPSLSIIHLLRSRELNQVNYSHPSEVLKSLNQAFQRFQHDGQYFTIWYGVYDRRKNTLVYSCAGHPPAILIYRDSAGRELEQYLKTPGLPIGMFLEAEYVDEICQIPLQSCLYIFSDGIYEIQKSTGELLGIGEFIKLLKSSGENHSNNLDLLLENIRSKSKKNQFDDDLSVLKIDFSIPKLSG